MSDWSWIAPTAAALSAMVVAAITAIRSRDNGKKVDRVLEKTEAIHAASNGALTEAKAATAAATSVKDVLEEKVEGLIRELAALKLSGTLAATAAAQAATDVRVAQAVVPPSMKAEEDC